MLILFHDILMFRWNGFDFANLRIPRYFEKYKNIYWECRWTEAVFNVYVFKVSYSWATKYDFWSWKVGCKDFWENLYTQNCIWISIGKHEFSLDFSWIFLTWKNFCPSSMVRVPHFFVMCLEFHGSVSGHILKQTNKKPHLTNKSNYFLMLNFD